MGTTIQPISRGRARLLVALAGGLGLAAILLAWPGARASAVTCQTGARASAVIGDAFVLRFSPLSQTFQVFTIPTRGAAPDGIAVFERAGATEVWFTEPGADQIGRLVYTDTTQSSLTEYPLPAGSRPLNVAVDAAGAAWFTENGRNRIGRIDGATGLLHEFVISTTDVAPLDLVVAPNGAVWFTENGADRFGRLIVHTPTEYEVAEFFVGLSGAGPTGVLVENNDKIWAALSHSNKLACLQSSVPRVTRTPALYPPPAYPFRLAIAPGGQRMWFTELEGNNISLYMLTTQEFGLRYAVPTGDSRPYDLDVDSTGAVWFSEQRGGKIGRLVLTTTAAFAEFNVPVPGARVQGITVDSQDIVWAVADVFWRTMFLPLTMRSGG